MATAGRPRSSLAPYGEYPVQRLLRHSASRHPHKVAIIDGDRTFTYRQLDEYSDRFAGSLVALGVNKGDLVGILAPNSAEFAIAFYGIVKAGAVATTVNSGYRERELAHQLNDSACETLVVHETLLSTAQAARDGIQGLKRLIMMSETSKDSGTFWDLIEHALSRPPSVTIEPKQDLAALPYSGGTTGFPKGVMLTHFNLTTNLRQFLFSLGEAAMPKENDVVLVHLPMFHIYGLQGLMNATVTVGATQVMMGRFDMELLLRLSTKYRVTHLFTVPPVGLGLTTYPGVEDYDLTALKVGLIGAAPFSADSQAKLHQALGCPVIQGYGMTELSAASNMDHVEPHLMRPGSVGPAIADTEEKVVDLESGADSVAPGTIGELMVRGPQVMKGYFNNPQATAETIVDDGWLHTGDIVRMDADGYVWVLDRKKELIKYKGFQVPPAELEALLLEHPAVADVAVIGKPDSGAGEIPKAFVVLQRGTQVSSEDLISFAAEKVATFKRLREVEFVDTIPKTQSGKILRRVLIEVERAKLTN